MNYLDDEKVKTPRVKKERSWRKEKRHRKEKGYVVVGPGNACPKCHLAMERRAHKDISEKVLKQAYYYTTWDYCIACSHLQHYEQYKRYNRNDASQYAQFKEQERGYVDFIVSC